MTFSQVEAIWDTAHELPLIEENPSEKQVLRLAAQSGCSAYDCLFAALAQEQGLLLVTFDRKLLNKFPRITISPQQMIETS